LRKKKNPQPGKKGNKNCGKTAWGKVEDAKRNGPGSQLRHKRKTG